MDSFLADAQRIFDVARQGAEPEDLTIRISAENGIHILSGSDYSPSSATTYRIRRGQGRVTVDGCSGSRNLTLAVSTVPMMLRDRPRYLLAN